MSKKFSLSEGMLNGISRNIDKSNTLEAKNNFKVEYIDIKNIKRNEKNFYEIVEIDELAEDIKINGLNHNLVVRKLEDNTYELISGERRYTALTKLVQEGNSIFALVPCKVIEANDIDTEIILIQANAQTRELSESEKLEQVKRLAELYKTKKANGEEIGRIRDNIAKDLNLSAVQVGRYERINNGLIPELKAILEEGNLTTANASEFSTLSEENQKVILEVIKDKVKLSKEEARELKAKLKDIEQKKELELKEIEDKKESELRENKSLVARYLEENNKLKAQINSKENEKFEEIKQIEGQLKVELEKKINEKYLIKIEEVKREAKENFEEKEKLKKEISNLKANAPKENFEELTENLKLKQLIELADKAIIEVRKQSNLMINKKINFSDDIKSELEHARISSTLFKSLLENFK
ncbi:MAG: ParB N-terminal domain-containing protein [Clostridium paraputrificum]